MIAAPAAAKSFNLTNADIEVVVEPDGSVLVVENITYDFDGSFTGAWRDIPLRAGEDVVDVGVAEEGVAYQPGAPTQLGSPGDLGSFGVEQRAGIVRVVWHYAAFNEARTFTISYRLVGLAVAYDDVVMCLTWSRLHAFATADGYANSEENAFIVEAPAKRAKTDESVFRVPPILAEAT